MKIQYNKQFVDDEDILCVVNSLKSDFLTQGPNIQKFENKLKLKFKSKYCSVLNNGTAALHLAIKSLKIKKNKKIVTSPITFISTASSVIMNGLIPEFCDIDSETFTLDPNKLEHLLKKDKQIAAVIGVDYAGNPCDWSDLNFLKKKYNIKLINDNCHAMGSKYKNDGGYAVKYSDIVTQSYHAIKNFTTGEGGSILTNDKEIYDFVCNFRTHNMKKILPDIKRFGRWYYKVDEIGYNYRLTDFQSSLGISQLKKLDKFVKKRRLLAKNYDFLLKDVPFIKMQKTQKNSIHSYHLYPVLIDFKSIKKDKKIFFNNMLKKNIFLQVNYQPLHYQPFIKKINNYKKKSFPVSEKFYEFQVSLPIHYKIEYKDQLYVTKNLIKNLKS